MTKSPSPSALPDLVKLAKVAMDKAMENTRREFAAIRTGKATTQLLDLVKVDAYGNLLPLNQVASVAAPDPRLLTVTVWDKGLVQAVEKAIRDSDLGLNPAAAGTLVRVDAYGSHLPLNQVGAVAAPEARMRSSSASVLTPP